MDMEPYAINETPPFLDFKASEYWSPSYRSQGHPGTWRAYQTEHRTPEAQGHMVYGCTGSKTKMIKYYKKNKQGDQCIKVRTDFFGVSREIL